MICVINICIKYLYKLLLGNIPLKLVRMPGLEQMRVIFSVNKI